MRRSKTIQILRDNLPVIRTQFGVKDLMLFGSVVRDEAKQGSDVDILVEFEQQPDFDRFMDLKFFLEDLLGTKVDLVTRNALKPRLRPIIEQEALRVA